MGAERLGRLPLAVESQQVRPGGETKLSFRDFSVNSLMLLAKDGIVLPDQRVACPGLSELRSGVSRDCPSLV